MPNSLIPSNSNYCYSRPDIISKLQKEYSLIIMVTSNLSNYHEITRNYVNEIGTSIDPDTILVDRRFNHCSQVQERLNFLK